MKKITKISILLIVFLLLVFNDFAQNYQFQSLKNLYGGNVLTLDNVGTTTIYAGTSCGIYRSSDNGESWVKELNGVTVYKIKVYSEELVYAGTNQGLYARRANHWDKIAGFTDKPINDLDVLTSGIVFVSVQNEGLFKGNITDNVFTKVTTLGYASSEYLITCSGDSTVFVDRMMSTDGGETWEKMDNGWPEFRFLNVLAVNLSDSLIIAGTDNGVFRYDLATKTWIDLKLYQACLDMDIDDGGRIFLSSAGGVYRSTDRGDTWQQINLGLSSAFVQSVCILGNNVFAGTPYGVDVCPLDGTSWSSVNNGISEVPVYSLLPFDDQLLISSGRGVLLTDNDGELWKTTRRMDYGITFTDKVHKFLKASDGVIYAGTSTGLYFSGNGGSSWLIYSGYVGQQVYDFVFDKNGNLLKATADGVFKSTDNGMNWTKLNENTNLGTLTCIVTDDDNHIYVGSYSGIYESDDGGAKWNDISQDSLKDTYFNKLVYSGNRIYAATTKGVYTYDIFYKNWSKNDVGIGTQYVSDLIRTADGEFYAATYSGIYYSSDSGGVWQAIDMGDVSKKVNCIRFDMQGNLYFGTADNGVYTSKTSLTDVLEETTELEMPALSNFPNPFRHSTTITYTIPKAFGNSPVTLSIINMLGQKIKTLVDTYQNPGKYKVVFRPEGLVPGIYFYSLKVGMKKTLKKMVLTE